MTKREQFIEIGKRYDLPELVGTDKQIAYAEDLRRYYLGKHSYFVEETEDCFRKGLKDADVCAEIIASGLISAKTADEITIKMCHEYNYKMMQQTNPEDYGAEEFDHSSMCFVETNAAVIINALK